MKKLIFATLLLATASQSAHALHWCEYGYDAKGAPYSACYDV